MHDLPSRIDGCIMCVHLATSNFVPYEDKKTANQRPKRTVFKPKHFIVSNF